MEWIIKNPIFYWYLIPFMSEAVEVIEAADVLRPGKLLLRTSESSRFLNSALHWCFEKDNFLVESWNIMLNFRTFSVGGCWGQPRLLFWKLVDETQISKPLEPIRHQNSKKYWSFYPSELNYFSHFSMRYPVLTIPSDLSVEIYLQNLFFKYVRICTI